MSDHREVSVVVPMFNELDSVRPLVTSVREGLTGWNWELIVIDDGSTDGTLDAAVAEAAGDPRIRTVRLARNYGQSIALQAGFDAARGEVVVSMDGDLQNDPRDIPMLVARLHDGFDLVSGYRERRQDALVSRKIPSWLANRIIGWITGIRIRDNGCSLKAYRRTLLRHLHLYADMHRFIPALAVGAAGARIAEVPVRHHARRFGASKYGLTRVFKVLGDLLTLVMIRGFRERPLVLFGGAGIGAAIIGVGLGIVGLWGGAVAPGETTSVVLPSASLLCFGLAGFLTILGLFGEEVLRIGGAAADPPPIVREARGR